MKRGLVSVLIFSVLIISMSFVSAGFFGDLWSGLTGEATSSDDDAGCVGENTADCSYPEMECESTPGGEVHRHCKWNGSECVAKSCSEITEYYCDNIPGCSWKETTKTCSETDDGRWDYDNIGKVSLKDSGNLTHKKSDSCSGDILTEYYCYEDSFGVVDIKSETYDCSQEGKTCVDGECVEEQSDACSETDGGKNYEKKGRNLGFFEKESGDKERINISDACIDELDIKGGERTYSSKYLAEVYCDGGLVKFEAVECDGKCVGGVCVEENQSEAQSSCDPSSQECESCKDLFNVEIADFIFDDTKYSKRDICTQDIKTGSGSTDLILTNGDEIFTYVGSTYKGSSTEGVLDAIKTKFSLSEMPYNESYLLVGSIEDSADDTYMHCPSHEMAGKSVDLNDCICFSDGAEENYPNFSCDYLKDTPVESAINFNHEFFSGTSKVCNDTDGGKDVYEKGKTTEKGATSPWTDACINESYLTEHWCGEGGKLRGEPIKCSGKCVDGACVKENASEDFTEFEECKSNLDRDGPNYHLGSKNDKCIDSDTLNESYCSFDGELNYMEINCDSGCVNGSCKGEFYKEKCDDSEKIYNISSKGVISYDGGLASTTNRSSLYEILSDKKGLFKMYAFSLNASFAKNNPDYFQGDYFENEKAFLKNSEVEKITLEEGKNYSILGIKRKMLDIDPQAYSPNLTKIEWRIVGAEDYCLDSKYLLDYSCHKSSALSLGDDADTLKYMPKEVTKLFAYKCSGKCVDGACVKENASDESTKENCSNGCEVEGNCVQVGFRSERKYCSLEGEMVPQLDENQACSNNFECETNVCVDGKCVSKGFLEKVFEWFSKIFS